MGARQSRTALAPSRGAQKKVLVTGGSGLLGRPLLQELVDRDLAVASLSAKSWQDKHPHVQALFSALGVESYTLDLCADAEQAGRGLAGIIREGGFDLVINLAADRGGVKYDGVRMAMNNYTLNTELPACLADIAADQGIPVFLISTEYVWTGRDNTEDGYPAVPVGTDDRFVGEAGPPYAIQKRKAEAIAEERRVRLATGDSVTIIRVPVLYGELISPLEDGTATASIHNFLAENTWKHDTWQRRYPTHSGDAAAAIAALARKRLSGGLQHPVYNYGAQTTMSKYDFVAAFAGEAGLPVECVQQQDASTLDEGKRPPFDVRLDNRLTREELEAVSDWREPRSMDGQLIRELFFGMYAEAIQRKRDELELTFTSVTLPDGIRRPVDRSITTADCGGDTEAAGCEDTQSEVTMSSTTSLFVTSSRNRLREILTRQSWRTKKCSRSQLERSRTSHL